MKIIECKYCHKKFETDGSFQQIGVVSAHMRTCPENPDREKNIEARKRGSAMMNRIVCERQRRRKLEDDATLREYEFKCKYCGKPYRLALTDRHYKRFIEGKGKYRRCCESCWHSAGGRATAEKRRKPPKPFIRKKICKSPEILKCLVCGNDFAKVGRNKFCSPECRSEFRLNRVKYLSAETRARLSAAGRRSAAKQSESRRSKCEAMFCQLCEQEFQNVAHNVPVFNGWDADIILPEQKIAVLWNGPWHYKQISRKPGKTLRQIQNRDALKKNEILKAGWSLYVVKDLDSRMSRASKDDKKARQYVERHFSRFLDFVRGQTGQFFEEFELQAV